MAGPGASIGVLRYNKARDGGHEVNLAPIAQEQQT
jgi:hypothetical protein